VFQQVALAGPETASDQHPAGAAPGRGSRSAANLSSIAGWPLPVAATASRLGTPARSASIARRALTARSTSGPASTLTVILLPPSRS